MSNREMMNVEIKMLKPRNDVEHFLSYGSEPVLYSMPTIWDSMIIEVYEVQYTQGRILVGGCEWRLVKNEETATGTAKKVVKFDSYEACYSNKAIALRDALLFCSIKDM